MHIGGKTRKIYDRAQTPYQRVLTSPSVKEEIKQKLTRQYQLLNPAQLHRDLHMKLQKLKELIG